MGMETLRPAEAARKLGISKATLYKTLRRGELPAVRVGRQWRISEAALTAFLRGDKTRNSA